MLQTLPEAHNVQTTARPLLFACLNLILGLLYLYGYLLGEEAEVNKEENGLVESKKRRLT